MGGTRHGTSARSSFPQLPACMRASTERAGARDLHPRSVPPMHWPRMHACMPLPGACATLDSVQLPDWLQSSIMSVSACMAPPRLATPSPPIRVAQLCLHACARRRPAHRRLLTVCITSRCRWYRRQRVCEAGVRQTAPDPATPVHPERVHNLCQVRTRARTRHACVLVQAAAAKRKDFTLTCPCLCAPDWCLRTCVCTGSGGRGNA